jgi:hypothetical protein
MCRAVARRDNWGGVYIHIFMFTYRKNNRFPAKEIRRAEHEYMNMHPPIIDLATALPMCMCKLKLIIVEIAVSSHACIQSVEGHHVEFCPPKG